MRAPKPADRPDRVSLWRYAALFREDILSAQPARLFSAKMAEFRTPFFRSFLINQTDLVRLVLEERAGDFPKSRRLNSALLPLLGRHSVFLTNGPEWQRARRIIGPAFEHGRVRSTFPAMRAAVADAVESLNEGEFDAEYFASRLAADIIFRTLFSEPVSEGAARALYEELRAYQKAQPILNAAAFFPVLDRLPFVHRRAARKSAARIRAMIAAAVDARAARIADGTAPDDLATRIMTGIDPESGTPFSRAEMIDQVAIFLLAGHETSAAALGWALYLLAADPAEQERAAAEAMGLPTEPEFADLAALGAIRNAFRETLRLYPPVPMMVRQARCPERFRNREVPKGAQIVISLWHLHRHAELWDRADDFCPARFDAEADRDTVRQAFLPFSRGPRVCVGASFAMAEGVLALAMLLRAFSFDPVNTPVPRAFLTLRSKDGIRLRAVRRDVGSQTGGSGCERAAFNT